MKPIISADMKEQNRRVAYQYIRKTEGQTFSRAGLSRDTGISGPTVLKIVSFLEERGMIVPNGSSGTGEPGRRANMYKFAPGAGHALGVAYDGQMMEMSLIDLNYQTVKYSKKPLRADVSGLVGQVLPAEAAEFLSGVDGLLGVGIALPSVVDTAQRKVSCQAFPTMQPPEPEEDISAECSALEQALGLPVLLENDVNAAALAEFRMRDMDEDDDLFYLMLGGGVGAGVILDGKLRRGRNFSCGEVGYMVWDQAFHTDSRKSGYLEWELYRYTRDRFGVDLLSAQDEPLPYELTEHIAGQLALVTANIANSMDVQNFVLGGSVYRKLGFTLLKLVNRELKGLCLHGVTVGESMCPDSSAKGAASLILDARLDSLLAD